MDLIPPLNPLISFVRAAESQSIAEAAKRLHVTPAAVRKGIATLESYLGVKLFRRVQQHLELTEAGTFYMHGLEGAIERIEAATRALLVREERDILHICAYPSFVMRWLIPNWSEFKTLHPGVDVRFSTTLGPVEYERLGIDAAILTQERDFGDNRSEFLFTTRLIPVCSPALLGGTPRLAEPGDLVNFPLLHAVTRQRDWANWLAAYGVDGIDPTGGQLHESSSMAYQAAIEGLGVAIGIEMLLSADMQMGLLANPFPQLPGLDLSMYLVYPEGKGTSVNLKRFRDWIRDAANRTKATRAKPQKARPRSRKKA